MGCFSGFLIGREEARYMKSRRHWTILFTCAIAQYQGRFGLLRPSPEQNPVCVPCPSLWPGNWGRNGSTLPTWSSTERSTRSGSKTCFRTPMPKKRRTASSIKTTLLKYFGASSAETQHLDPWEGPASRDGALLKKGRWCLEKRVDENKSESCRRRAYKSLWDFYDTIR